MILASGWPCRACAQRTVAICEEEVCVCVCGGGGSCQRRKQDREVKSTFRGEGGKVILLTNDGNEMEKAKGKGRRER